MVQNKSELHFDLLVPSKYHHVYTYIRSVTWTWTRDACVLKCTTEEPPNNPPMGDMAILCSCTCKYVNSHASTEQSTKEMDRIQQQNLRSLVYTI